jgi:nucleotide-binding universal stress UspA family protein
MKILLAIDESRYSQEATRTLLAQFRTQDVEVRVLSVVEPISAYVSADVFPHFVPQVEKIEEDRKKQATDLASQVAKDLRGAGFKTSELICQSVNALQSRSTTRSCGLRWFRRNLYGEQLLSRELAI